MDKRHPEPIRSYLQKDDVQKRICQNIERSHAKMTVTIGRVCELFNFSENQLRDWEDQGLVNPIRSRGDSGLRLYPPNELIKIAIISELLENGDFKPGAIPQNLDHIWHSVSSVEAKDNIHLYLDQRVGQAQSELFWRFYASQALQLSLMLICEEMPDMIAALVLPLHQYNADTVSYSRDLPKIGASLICWLDESRSIYVFLDLMPSFEDPSDYLIHPLKAKNEKTPQDNTLFVIRKGANSLELGVPIVDTIRRLLAPLYENAENLNSLFGQGLRDMLYPTVNFLNSTQSIHSHLLDDLADMIVRLGGCISENQNRWPFCCILLPEDPLPPLQLTSLIVRAQSEKSPHKIGTIVSPNKAMNSLSLRAYQSGHVLYRPEIAVDDAFIDKQEVEGSVQSAIAIPIGGENGSTVAVLYIASDEREAFPESQQRVLRMVSRMIEEALLNYRVRQQVTDKLTKVINHPRSIDPLFEEFLSENEFVNDIAKLLATLKVRLKKWKEPKKREEVPLDERKAQYKAEQLSGEVVSFIAVDIDNQSSLATKYGNQVARNLSRVVGLRIQGQQHLFEDPEYRRLYHIYADRFYLLLKGMTLDEARDQAERLRIALEGEYPIDAHGVSGNNLLLRESMLQLPKITVRLGVASYGYSMLKQLLQHYHFEISVASIRAKIIRDIDEVLNRGWAEGGNVVISLDVDNGGYIRWSPLKHS